MNTAKVSTFIRRNAALWPIVLMSVLLFIGFYLYPWVRDDLGYREGFVRHFLYGDSVKYQDIYKAFVNLMYSDNNRIGNIVMLHLIFVPKWVTALLSAIICAISVWLSLKLIDRQRDVSAVLLMCSAFVFALPWVDQMYVFDYQRNYIWGAAICLWLSAILIKGKSKWPLVFLLGIIAGAWQECSGLPTLAACCALFLFYPKYRNKRIMAAIVGLFIGLVWLWYSPGAGRYRLIQTSFAESNKIVIIYFIPIFISAIIYIYRLAKHKVTAVDTFLIAVAVTPCLVAMKYPIVRLMWWGDLAACVGIISAINTNIRTIKWLTGVAYILMCVHLVVVDKICFTERDNYEFIVDKIRTTPYEETIYADILSTEDKPLISLYKPGVNNFSHYRNMHLIVRFWSNSDTVRCIVPRQLEGIKSTDGEAIGGNDGFRYINGYIVGLSVADWPCGLPLTVEIGGHTFSEGFYHVPFMTADGKQMAWYHPDQSSLRVMLNQRVDKLKFQ